MPDAPARSPLRARPRMVEEVGEGLRRPQKEIPPKYFYDHRGSLLFERITRLPEYYLTRTERALLEAWMPSLLGRLQARTLIELGAGSAAKTRIILDAMQAAGTAEAYLPIDVSAGFLEETAHRLRAEYPGLQIRPVVADLTSDVPDPGEVPRPVLYALLGSTIGNFEAAPATRLLARIRSRMTGTDRLLLGVDLHKDVERIEAAYNDAEGLTAEFNRNVLQVLNRDLGSNFDPAAFEHRAFYDRRRRRIEMRLVSTREQEIVIPGIGVIPLARGESIRTEISCKYDRAEVEAMFATAGLRVSAWKTDPERLFALALGAPATG